MAGFGLNRGKLGRETERREQCEPSFEEKNCENLNGFENNVGHIFFLFLNCLFRCSSLLVRSPRTSDVMDSDKISTEIENDLGKKKTQYVLDK